MSVNFQLGKGPKLWTLIVLLSIITAIILYGYFNYEPNQLLNP